MLTIQNSSCPIPRLFFFFTRPSHPDLLPSLSLSLFTNKPQILAKAEFSNPGGSVKDRVAAAILAEATTSSTKSKKSTSTPPLLRPGGLVTEGTAGSTGVSLAMLSSCFGVRAAVWMPDDAAEEKSAMVRRGERKSFFFS